mmetsp:Transcript_69539/g.151837  ORF Transcript_69539/g.151837 Transcript_69539/m.151837 type:complete len:258 (+) Transcript_69539:136-909(+)
MPTHQVLENGNNSRRGEYVHGSKKTLDSSNHRLRRTRYCGEISWQRNKYPPLRLAMTSTPGGSVTAKTTDIPLCGRSEREARPDFRSFVVRASKAVRASPGVDEQGIELRLLTLYPSARTCFSNSGATAMKYLFGTMVRWMSRSASSLSNNMPVDSTTHGFAFALSCAASRVSTNLFPLAPLFPLAQFLRVILRTAAAAGAGGPAGAVACMVGGSTLLILNFSWKRPSTLQYSVGRGSIFLTYSNASLVFSKRGKGV